MSVVKPSLVQPLTEKRQTGKADKRVRRFGGKEIGSEASSLERRGKSLMTVENLTFMNRAEKQKMRGRTKALV